MPSRESIDAVFASTPANRFLDFRLGELRNGAARVAMPVAENLIQENGIVHGGFLTTLADTAAVYAIVPQVEDPSGLTGVELKLNFLRPGRNGAGEIEASSTLVKLGRTLAVVEVSVTQAGHELARGLFTYFVGAARSGG